MIKTEVLDRESISNSVYHELTRDFRVTLRAAKRVLGEAHLWTNVCRHAAIFPTDRMSLRLVWDQFEALPFAQRMEILQAVRNRKF